MTSQNGGPAFPGGLWQPASGGENDREPMHHGMTLRDYLAASYEPGDDLSVPFGERVMGRPCPSAKDDAIGCLIWWANYRSALRYMEADAMLRAREAETKPSRYAGASHD